MKDYQFKSVIMAMTILFIVTMAYAKEPEVLRVKGLYLGIEFDEGIEKTKEFFNKIDPNAKLEYDKTLEHIGMIGINRGKQ